MQVILSAIKKGILTGVVIFLTLWSLYTAVVLFGGPIDSAMSPLFTDISVSATNIKDNTTSFVIIGIKNRECSIYAISARVLLDNDTWVPGFANITDKDGNKIPLAQQRVAKGDKFVRTFTVSPAGERVSLTVTSVCNPVWFTKQVIADVKVHEFAQPKP